MNRAIFEMTVLGAIAAYFFPRLIYKLEKKN